MDLMASFSTHNKYTTVEGYVRFRHTLALIQQKDAACFDVHSTVGHKKKLLEMAAFIGYSQSSYSKFLRRRDGWLRLEGRIPEKYFRFIGIKPAVLDFTLQLDKEEFEYALSLPAYPRNFIIRYMPAVYGPKELPEGTTEQEAIAMIKAFQEEHKLRCCINIHQIKTIFVEPGRGCSTVIYPPRLKRTTEGFYVASEDGVGTGVAQVR